MVVRSVRRVSSAANTTRAVVHNSAVNRAYDARWPRWRGVFLGHLGLMTNEFRRRSSGFSSDVAEVLARDGVCGGILGTWPRALGDGVGSAVTFSGRMPGRRRGSVRRDVARLRGGWCGGRAGSRLPRSITSCAGGPASADGARTAEIFCGRSTGSEDGPAVGSRRKPFTGRIGCTATAGAAHAPGGPGRRSPKPSPRCSPVTVSRTDHLDAVDLQVWQFSRKPPQAREASVFDVRAGMWRTAGQRDPARHIR